MVVDDARRVLGHLVSAVLKRDDAPCSAATHLNTAIALLARLTAWRPTGDAERRVIEDALTEIGVRTP